MQLLGGGGWDFHAEFLDHVITGPGRAAASTETFGHTLRFNDGGDDEDTGDMALDDTPRIDIELGFAITGDADDLPSDQLPEEFRFAGAPHTFFLRDSSGQMNLQFTSFRQVVTRIKLIEHQPGTTRIVWCSLSGKHYAVEFSTDLDSWETIATNIEGSPKTSEFIDVDPERRVPRGFYRIREILREQEFL